MGNEQEQHCGVLTSKHSKEVFHCDLQGEHTINSTHVRTVHKDCTYTVGD